MIADSLVTGRMGLDGVAVPRVFTVRSLLHGDALGHDGETAAACLVEAGSWSPVQLEQAPHDQRHDRVNNAVQRPRSMAILKWGRGSVGAASR